jgi:hypothetical protein
VDGILKIECGTQEIRKRRERMCLKRLGEGEEELIWNSLPAKASRTQEKDREDVGEESDMQIKCGNQEIRRRKVVTKQRNPCRHV